MTDKLTHKLTDSDVPVKHRNTGTLEWEIIFLRWNLKTKQNIIDRLLKDRGLTAEEREAIELAAGICEEHAEEYDGAGSCPIAATLRKLLERLS